MNKGKNGNNERNFCKSARILALTRSTDNTVHKFQNPYSGDCTNYVVFKESTYLSIYLLYLIKRLVFKIIAYI